MEAMLNPFIYLAFLLVVWQCYRLRTWHRRFWGVSLFSPRPLSIVRIGSGLAAGAVFSAIFMLSRLDFTLTATHMWWLWAAVILLGLIRLRFMNINYAAGIVCIGVLLSEWIDVTTIDATVREGVLSLQTIDVVSLLLFAGMMTVVSGLLVMWQGERAYCPLLLPRRGKSVGAIALQSLWAIPVMIPTVTGWFLFPVLTVYTDLAITRSTQARARLSGLMMVVFGITITIISLLSARMQSLLWVAAIWTLIGQEVWHWWSKHQEQHGTPRYMMRKDGVRVLGVRHGSPAAEMGIAPGDTITGANGQAVTHMTELYAALQHSPAFCKLEVTDEQGEKRFVQRSRYANEPHQLGILPVENTAHPGGISSLDRGWWQFFTKRTHYERLTMEKSRDQ